ncbi:MAG: DUF427 domain-containing protein [Solirubrobacteraceae bacterium]
MEAVRDYPRPPALVPTTRRVRIELAGETIAESGAALRVLETASPPTIYVPLTDVRPGVLVPSGHRQTFCEWKGPTSYYDIVVGDRRVQAGAWYYPEPVEAYAALRDHVSFYPGRVDGAYLDDELVRPQDGDFYGGWITADIEGPFKGAPGTLHW